MKRLQSVAPTWSYFPIHFFACQIILRVGRKLAKLPASNRLSLNVCRLSIYYYQNTKRLFLTNIFHCTELCTAAYLDKWGWKALPFPFENHVNGKMDKVPLVCRLMEEATGRLNTQSTNEQNVVRKYWISGKHNSSLHLLYTFQYNPRFVYFLHTFWGSFMS